MMLKVDNLIIINYQTMMSAVSRFFYHMVRESGNLVTELTTDPDYSTNFRKIKYVDDHYFKPESCLKVFNDKTKRF